MVPWYPWYHAHHTPDTLPTPSVITTWGRRISPIPPLSASLHLARLGQARGGHLCSFQSLVCMRRPGTGARQAGPSTCASQGKDPLDPSCRRLEAGSRNPGSWSPGAAIVGCWAHSVPSTSSTSGGRPCLPPHPHPNRRGRTRPLLHCFPAGPSRSGASPAGSLSSRLPARKRSGSLSRSSLQFSGLAPKGAARRALLLSLA